MVSGITESTQDSIKATINYFQAPADGGPPAFYDYRLASGKRKPLDPRRVRVRDLRCVENEFDLDSNGFQMVQRATKEKAFDEDDSIKAIYYPEIEQLIKEKTGASHAHVFSHIIRRYSKQDEINALKHLRDDETFNLETPATFAHIDQSYNGAPILLDSVIENSPTTSILPSLRANAHRWAILNAWRPLKPITREPLAICDAATVSESDLREITTRLPSTPDRPAPRYYKLWQVAANPRHRWYWPKDMMPEEVLLIKCFDSRRDVARWAPHSAIQTEEDFGPARESIEVRCLVFWEGWDGSVEKARL